MNEQQQPPNDGLPQVTIDDLLKMIGDRDVTIQRQGLLIAQQHARLAELDKGNVTQFDEDSKKAKAS
tara:strand:- start:482 stop:682 length:201 start_codon:yes stop_codon:yes gene_type:complete